MTQTLAEVYAIVGEQEKAIDLLDGLLSRPGNLTVAILKISSDLGFAPGQSSFYRTVEEIRWLDLARHMFSSCS